MGEGPGRPSDEALVAQDNGLLPATPADVPEVKMVVQQAADYKLRKGDDLWGEKPFTDEEITSMLDSGNLYVYKVDGRVAASVLLADSDERMWGEEGNDGTAVYIHRLSVGDDFRGQEVGPTVTELTAEQALAKGKTKIRLDCAYDNPELCARYESMGFREVRRYDRPKSMGGRNPNKDVYRAALFEKDIAV